MRRALFHFSLAALLGASLAAPIALAQTSAPEIVSAAVLSQAPTEVVVLAAPAPTLMDLFVQHAAPPILIGLAGLLSLVFAALARKITGEGTASKVAQVGARVLHFVGLVVREIEQTLRPEIAEVVADGKISEPERARLKNLALSRVKALLGEHGLKEIQTVLGIAAPQVEHYLSGLIESAVLGLREESIPVGVPFLAPESLVDPRMVPVPAVVPPTPRAG